MTPWVLNVQILVNEHCQSMGNLGDVRGMNGNVMKVGNR